jgi:hypothetical protein
MAQADQVVQNDNFPTVRADINNNLAALFTNSSGGTAPTVTVAYQDWIDTSGADPIWKKRNAANNAWITVATIKSSTVELAADNVLPSQSGQSGNYLTTNGTVASWGAIISGINDIEFFASSGSWTCPAGIAKAFVTVAGGGGGGGGAGGGGANTGAAGGVGIGLVTVTPGTTYTITVGAGGAGTNANANGTSGGSSSFGSVITATGGQGGSFTGTAAAGICTDAAANLCQSNTGLVRSGPFAFNNLFLRDVSNNAAVAWSKNGLHLPGAGGRGEGSLNLSSGGVGGAVLIWY